MSKQGVNLSDIKETNSSRVMELILNNENITRVEISERTNLTQASISKTTKQLIEQGLIYEDKFVKGKSGRRSIGLKVNYNYAQIIGVKISRGYYQIALFNLDCQIIEMISYDYSEDNPGSFIANLALNIRRLLDLSSNVILISIAVPGPFNHKNGKIELMTEYNYLDHVDIYSLTECFEVPIIASQDANSACLASFNYYGLDPSSDLAFYYLDKGVGAGISQSGQLITGDLGTAGEIGHISIDYQGDQCSCGNRGCLELYCSSIAILRKIKSRYNLVYKSIDEFYAKGPEEEFYDDFVKNIVLYISLGALNLVNAYNPKFIIIGGEVMKGVDQLKNPILKRLSELVVDNIFEETEFIFVDKSYDFVLYGTGYIGVDFLLNNFSLLN